MSHCTRRFRPTLCSADQLWHYLFAATQANGFDDVFAPTCRRAACRATRNR